MIKLTRAAKTKQFPDEMSERLYNQYGGLKNDLFYEKLKKLKCLNTTKRKTIVEHKDTVNLILKQKLKLLNKVKKYD